jgi:ATP-dependent RNA helicase RhlE
MKEESKNRELQRQFRRETGSIIVFTRSKDGATRVWRSLHSAGFYDATFIHSDRAQKDRELALAEFKEGKYRILIATDVAARGLHIEGVSLVVNYDLPMEAEDYVHRIGRTGRAGASGKALTFCTTRDRAILRDIEKIVGREIPADFTDSFNRDDTGPSGSGGRGGDRDRGGGRGGPGGRGGDRGRGGHGGGGSNGSGGERPVLKSSGGPVIAPIQAFRSSVPAVAGSEVGPEIGDEHAHQHAGARNPRGHGDSSRDGSREHGPVPGAQGAPVDPHDPSQPPRKRRRRRGGRGRNKGGAGGGPDGGAGGGHSGGAGPSGGGSAT